MQAILLFLKTLICTLLLLLPFITPGFPLIYPILLGVLGFALSQKMTKSYDLATRRIIGPAISRFSLGYAMISLYYLLFISLFA